MGCSRWLHCHLTSYTFAAFVQNFPDAINQRNFPSVVLQPGETYKHQIVYRLSAHSEL